MRHIKPSSLGVSLVVILPLLWKGITCLPGYSIQVSSSVRVQEGLCVTIPCTFTVDYTNRFSDSFGYWIHYTSGFFAATNDKSSDVKKPNFNLTGNPDTGDCTLTITGARKEDAGEYFFRFEKSKYSRVKYSYNRETTTTITVTDLTEEPVIWDVGTLTAGIDKTVTCAPPGNCPVTSFTFQWKKSDVSGIWKNSSTITFTPSPDDHRKNITCEVTNSIGKTIRRSILLDVCCGISVTITSEINGEERPTSPQVDINPTETLTLVCRAEGNPPVTVVWVRGEDDVDTYNISNNGLSAVINVTSSEADVYRCFAWNGLGLKERRIQVGTKGVCMASSPSTIIIGTVIGNIVLLITVIVGSYFFMKRRIEKRQLGGRSPDPGAQEPESTYQELKGQKDDVYHNFKVQ